MIKNDAVLNEEIDPKLVRLLFTLMIIYKFKNGTKRKNIKERNFLCR